jgi:predicted transcriptional regulator
MDRREDVTSAELAIRQILWDRGATTARQLIDRLYPRGGASAHPTVQKLIERLETKGYVHRDRSGPVQVFTAKVEREVVIDQRLRAAAAELCGGSLSSLLSHLVDTRRLKPSERKALRAFLDQLDE